MSSSSSTSTSAPTAATAGAVVAKKDDVHLLTREKESKKEFPAAEFTDPSKVILGSRLCFRLTNLSFVCLFVLA